MDPAQTNFISQKKRPRPAVLIVVALVHVILFYGLLRALAPGAVSTVERAVVSTFNVTVTAPPEPEPEPRAPEESGAAGDPGKKAVPKPVAEPTPKVRVKQDRPAPRASSTGNADTSGAAKAGTGTGAAGTGDGTGSGNGGNGQGGGMVAKPVLLNSITDVRAFPVPPGGRQARIGKSVIVRLEVSAQGRVSSCSVYRASPFPETDAVVCQLAREQLRFEPARNGAGNPVSAPFYYEQRFFN